MISEISIDKALSSHLRIIDVRSPGEFSRGHIPTAINIPLFTNEERAEVGTVYKLKSKQAAIDLGYKYVNPKLDFFITESRKYAPNLKIIVHCWRGGMRSRSFAEHLSKNGFKETFIITGGYKSYRNFVLNYFSNQFKLKVLGGYTGSGKTHILHDIRDTGNQIIDLEALANHKGSVFGAIGLGEQPTTEHFENLLHHNLSKLDIKKNIWIEDESISIGKVAIPIDFFTQIREAPAYFINIPKEERAKSLIKEYTNCEKEILKNAIHKIAKRLGGQDVKMALEYIEAGDFYNAALISLHYYDKAYLHGMEKRDQSKVVTIDLEDTNHIKNTEIIKTLLKHY
ncbi:MAG: tRNA 2-selenouridine(34) synthase MnmH [Bacteroidales bacterium]|nr:tRNA 2-selenouridine(34) synthase MnmH [Bacteroidales bacterium]